MNRLLRNVSQKINFVQKIEGTLSIGNFPSLFEDIFSRQTIFIILPICVDRALSSFRFLLAGMRTLTLQVVILPTAEPI